MISLRAIERIFQVGDQQVHALSGIDLEIGAGEYLSLMGPSGSGKSSLLNIIGLLDRPTSGTYRLDGREVTTLSDEEQARVRREKIGFVFQFFHLVPRLTAAQNVELPMMLGGVPAQERSRRAQALLEAYGLGNRMHHRPDQLSGGQRQRVAIARATVMRPAVVLADEPTGNLDRTSGREVIEILEKLHEQGVTLIVVTHDPELGGRAQRCLRMVDGRIASDRRAPEARQHPR
ncbi:MAG TPA: ABC transporter ATP-binding protein [Burkholderiales bacterium]|jgi:putative ABC transport system ATP-binding protein|nr:ABC transporter ATP-binding protein [Burkholderiales bacterium]